MWELFIQNIKNCFNFNFLSLFVKTAENVNYISENILLFNCIYLLGLCQWTPRAIFPQKYHILYNAGQFEKVIWCACWWKYIGRQKAVLFFLQTEQVCWNLDDACMHFAISNHFLAILKPILQNCIEYCESAWLNVIHQSILLYKTVVIMACCSINLFVCIKGIKEQQFERGQNKKVPIYFINLFAKWRHD